ncbi:PQQ-binding-like beta-propeller repeat protein [Halobacterium sp. CBA1126]|uniref:outer membrane protein assembly factor BamB family protein n=1 Tax=Halobacterium sp. CBA1126 TaxID=2668074 RepID=UPI0012F7F1A8|nr:PQQ-binding-like beta-propeller repeat protein [Halobacterium sp. CBA1126]MUV61518.1 PQQ-binding-like beta-propeller repeat protein [Halobacterium sp. CBA1126]
MVQTRRALLGGLATAAAAGLAGCNALQRGDERRVVEPASGAWATRYGGGRGTAANDVAGVDRDPTRQWRERTFPQYDAGVFTADGGGFVLDTHTLTAVNPDGSVRWRSEAGYYDPVVLADEVVVAESMDGGLDALARSSGDRVWSVSGGEALAVADQRLLARTATETVAAVAPSGDAAWSASEPASYSPVTAATQETVVAAFTDRYRAQPDTDGVAERSTLVAYDAATGSEQWRFSVPGNVQRVAVHDDRVHVGTGVRDVNGAFGAFQHVLSLDDGSQEARRTYTGVWFDGLAVDSEQAFTATGTTVRGLGPQLGGPNWESTLPARTTSLAAAASSVYVTWSPDEGTVVAALDATSGEEQWRKSLPVGWAEVVGVTDGRVFVETSETPGLYVLG